VRRRGDRAKRRELIAGAISVAAGASRVTAEPTGAGQRLAIFSPSEPSQLMHEKSENRYYRALFEELRRLGHREGQNLTVERFGSEQNRSGAAALAADVIGSNPDVVYVVGPGARIFKDANARFPIVALTGDPIAQGPRPEPGAAGREHHRGQCRCRPVDSWQTDRAVA
jgi:putative ABC transport system substrate-binding protein